MHILVLGASGMLGNTITRYFQSLDYKVTAMLRSKKEVPQCFLNCGAIFYFDSHILEPSRMSSWMESLKPDIVINCIGIIKQSSLANDVLSAVPVNTLFPHFLANLCIKFRSRLIHFSTDCVFSGAHGMYTETSFPDASDLYGRSKLLGEVDYPSVITLRTSIIGHELNSKLSLVDWFLSQQDQVDGYKNAIFSGIPTIEIAKIIQACVLPNKSLRGLYHVSVDPISKYDLLCKISLEYAKNVDIIPKEDIIINRSLDSSKFRLATGFKPKSWDQMLNEMHYFR